MKCLYICFKFPTLSETFIAREIKHLGLLDWKIKIFRLYNAEKLNNFSFDNPDITMSPIMLKPILWCLGLVDAFIRNRNNSLKIIREFTKSKTTFSLKLQLLYLLLSAFGIAYYIKSRHEDYDHIRASFLHHEMVSAYWLSTLTGISYSITAYTRFYKFPKDLIQRCAENAAFCIATTNETFTVLKKLRGNDQGVHFIRTGVEFKQYDQEWSPPDTLNLLAVGRLVPKKGFDVLIRACEILREKKVNFQCSIIGTGIEFDPLQQQINDLGLSEQIHLLGALTYDQVEKYYRQSTMLLVPSRELKEDVDGLPTVIIEALSVGLPVISTNIAGIPDLVIDQETGFLIEQENDTALADAIIQLSNRVDLQIKFSRQGNQFVHEHYDIQKTIIEIDRLMRA